MSYLLLTIIIISGVFQSIFQKQFNSKVENKGVFSFGAMTAFAAVVVFCLTADHPLNFTTQVLPYSIAFSVSHASAILFQVLALRYGPMAITLLMVQYSLLIPTFYGIIFVKEPTSVLLYIGIILLLISLCLINYQKDDKKLSLKWIVYVILAFIGNGMCSTVQNMQVQKFNGTLKSEFMITALLTSVIVLSILSLINERKELKFVVKKGLCLALFCGIFNGIVNFLVILLLGMKTIPASVMFPCISAGGMLLTFFISVLAYKEKMSKMQIAGFFIGIGAVVFLNI